MKNKEVTKKEGITLIALVITKLGAYILAYSKTKKIEIQSKIEEIHSSTFAAAENLSEVIIHKEKDEISGSPWGNTFGDRAIIWDN